VAIILESHYPTIRAAIDLQIEEGDIPDSVIEMTIYKDAADQDVLDRVTDPDETDERIVRAAIYFCAARLCPVVIRLTTLNVQTRDMSYSRPAFDYQKRAAELIAMAEQELEEYGVDIILPVQFTVVSGTRGL
jgi:hypothetical protein